MKKLHAIRDKAIIEELEKAVEHIPEYPIIIRVNGKAQYKYEMLKLKGDRILNNPAWMKKAEEAKLTIKPNGYYAMPTGKVMVKTKADHLDEIKKAYCKGGKAGVMEYAKKAIAEHNLYVATVKSWQESSMLAAENKDTNQEEN